MCEFGKIRSFVATGISSLCFLVSADVAYAQNLETFKFSVPEVSPSKFLGAAAATNFDGISDFKRASSGHFLII